MPGSPEDASTDDPRLRELMLEVLERLDREGAAALEAACREHPELAEPLRRRVAALADLGLVDVACGGRAPERVGDFRLKEELGAGGMGVVYRAEQLSLGRDVALKLIRPDVLPRRDARERFDRETEIVARLQHPGIVPIHVVGGEDEVPYYAMELVPGCTLAEALAALPRRDPATLAGADLWRAARARIAEEPEATPSDAPGPLFAGSWEATCLRVVGQIADALQHAHERGVLHRDLKPSNVMITPGGRVMLLDFGLSQTEGAETMTGSGDHIGSLPYMPPELLADGPRVLDRRSDVYALGVTLYQLLTLKLPFRAESVPAAMARILEGRPSRPRAHHPGLSWEGETVCLAAMDRDPSRRYASAAELYDDLQNVLERRPIAARRASLPLRARRWVQRRPGEAAALVLLFLLPVVAAVLLARESRNVSAALTVAQDERARADGHRDRTLRAIREMLVQLSAEELDHVPGMLGLRRTVLGRATALYEELLAERPDDRETVLLATRCDVLHADLLEDEGRHGEAEALALAALARLEPWLARRDREARGLQARLLDAVSVARRATERHAEADAALAESIDVLRALVREDPAAAAPRAYLLSSLGDLAAAERRTGVDGGGLDQLRASVEGLRELARLRPDAETSRVLAVALHRLGGWLTNGGRAEEGAAALAEELAVRRALLDLEPEDERARYAVARTASNLASARILDGANERALELLRVALEEIERVRAGFPDLPDYEYAAADVHINRAAALGRLGRAADARAELVEARAILRRLCEAHPATAEYHRTLATTLVNMASMEVDLGDARTALGRCEEARALLEDCLAARPRSSDWRRWLGIEGDVRAKVLLALRRPGDAAESLVRTAEFAAHRRDVLVNALGRLALCLDQAGELDDEVQRELCLFAAYEVVALVDEGGLLGDHERLRGLQARLEDQ